MKKTLFLTASAIFLLSYTGCKRFELITKTIYTQPEINNITYNSVSVSTDILEVGDNLKSYGHCYGIEINPTVNDYMTINPGSNAAIGTFSEEISELNPNTTYFLRTYAEEDEIRYSKSQQTFTTNDNTSPTVTTGEVEDITGTTASCGGNVLNEGITSVFKRGVCWSISQNPTVSDSLTTDGSGIGTFTSSLTGLTESTNYYVRAYATNTEGTSYGEQKNFTTPELTTPVVTTADITNISYTSATSGGNVTNAGSSAVSVRGVCWSTNQNPVASDSHTANGDGTGTFISNLTNLTEYTTYYVRAYATNSSGTSYGEEKVFYSAPKITDYDENEYSQIKIGNQIWMAKNLKTTHYANGTAIPSITDNTAWANLSDNNTDDAYCYYDNSSANADIYGALYTWAAAMGDNAISSDANPSGVQGVCPDNWHLPSDAEWTELTNYLSNNGYSGIEGTALKATSGWNNDGNGTDNYGFTALPGGARSNSTGSFIAGGNIGTWCSATEFNEMYIWYRKLSSTLTDVYRNGHYKSYGFSVRCVKDE